MNIYQEPESLVGMKRYLAIVIAAIIIVLSLSIVSTASAAIGSTDYELHVYTPNLYGGFVPTFYASGSINQIDGHTAWIQSETCLQYADYPCASWNNIHCDLKPQQWTTSQSVPPPISLYEDPHNCEWISSWQWGAVLWTGGWQTKAIRSAAIRLC
jgi:hypothetical protein